MMEIYQNITTLFDLPFLMILSSNSLKTLPGNLPTSREVRGEVVGGSQGTWECLELRIMRNVRLKQSRNILIYFHHII